nr:hypothetical protein [Tanacetum cinerariifolium]
MMMVFRWWFIEWQQGGVSGVVDDDDGGCSGGAGCCVVGTATVVVGMRVAVAARGVGSVWKGDSGGGLWCSGEQAAAVKWWCIGGGSGVVMEVAAAVERVAREGRWRMGLGRSEG